MKRMLKYCSLYSGSSGNSFFVKSQDTSILIDAGVSTKKIITALRRNWRINRKYKCNFGNS